MNTVSTTETKPPVTLKPAPLGSISWGTLRPVDLLSAYISALEDCQTMNGDYFSLPEHFAERDRLAAAIGEAQDCFTADGREIDPAQKETANWLVNETLPDMLDSFAPPFASFGAHPGDGADFGFWPCDIEDIKDQVGFCSSRKQEFPADGFTGEWLHINERGNATLYVRGADGRDAEIWSVC
jgi:hypothetical protein